MHSQGTPGLTLHVSQENWGAVYKVYYFILFSPSSIEIVKKEAKQQVFLLEKSLIQTKINIYLTSPFLSLG